jgi:hypothetical protein
MMTIRNSEFGIRNYLREGAMRDVEAINPRLGALVWRCLASRFAGARNPRCTLHPRIGVPGILTRRVMVERPHRKAGAPRKESSTASGTETA